MRKRILVIGCGVLGGSALDLLLRSGDDHEYLVGGRDPEQLIRRTNLSLLVANNLGYSPRVRTVPIDLWNEDATAETIARTKPDIIFNATSLQTFWLISTLPGPVYRELEEAQLGSWLPMHLALTFKLARAVKSSGWRPRVVNGAYPDAVNPALQGVGLAPDVGIGNVANTIPALRRAIAEKFGCDPRTVEVKFYAHHYISNRVASCGEVGQAPFLLRAAIEGTDVTGQLDSAALFAALVGKWRRIRGVPGQVMAASSAVKVIRALANGCAYDCMHAPGPHGLPGGYAVRVSPEGVSVLLPPGVRLADAVAVNERGAFFDGIERIDPDGTVHFAEHTMEVMKRNLGYYCREMAVHDCEPLARELGAKYQEFASRFR